VHNSNIKLNLKIKNKLKYEKKNFKNIPPIGKKMMIKIQINFEHTPRPPDLSNSKIAIRSRIKMI
jgi:hypothetical protein